MTKIINFKIDNYKLMNKIQNKLVELDLINWTQWNGTTYIVCFDEENETKIKNTINYQLKKHSKELMFKEGLIDLLKQEKKYYKRNEKQITDKVIEFIQTL